MKYYIDDNVIYKGKKYKICSANEVTNFTTQKLNSAFPESKSVSVDIKYDLIDEDGNIVKDVKEYELEELTEYPFSRNVEYTLRNGLTAQYYDFDEILMTDEEISIPSRLYDVNGKCLLNDNFDIVSIKKNEFCCDKEDEDDFLEDDEELYDDTDKKKKNEVALSSEDGKYNVKFYKTPLGYGIMGNLPDEMQDIIKNVIKMIGENLDD